MSEPDARSPVLWEQVANAYRADRSRYPQKRKTAKRYETELARIGRFMAKHDTRPAEIDHTVVHRFVNFCLSAEDDRDEDGDEDGLALNSVLNAMTAFNRAMQAAMYGGLLTDPKAVTAVAAVQTYPRRDIKGRVVRLRPPIGGEHERLLPEVERLMPSMLLFVQFLHRTGCRTGEALRAQAVDIHREADGLRLHLWRGVKGEKARSILLNGAEELLPLLPQRGRLFPDLPEDVRAVSSLWGKFWSRRLTGAEIDADLKGRPLTEWEQRRWRLHDLRHAFACESILEGADLYALSEHLGHASVKTTEGYLKMLKELPVKQRRGLRRMWRGKRRPGRADEDEQPDDSEDPMLLALAHELPRPLSDRRPPARLTWGVRRRRGGRG